MTGGLAFVNDLGMRFVELLAGSFLMGSVDGAWDQQPVHRVTLTQPFAMAAAPVTNAQWEAFDPAHRARRGEHGLSRGDDEAVVNVSWRAATAYCAWLSARDGRPYRLPTEAEWEYACRAGATTAYWTGDSLPGAYQRRADLVWDPEPVDLTVGRAPANAWGLGDMVGVVEQWCLDGYGPYEAGQASDPLGRAPAEMRVTRGGSHNTSLRSLRSAHRGASLPDDASVYIGLRLVCAEPPAGRPLPPPPAPRWAAEVSQTPFAWPAPDSRPRFEGPQRYVHIAPGSNGPLYARHNHCPALTWCPNGDLLAVWFSCNSEEGREMTIAASRRRAGQSEWEPADEFFKAADRNMTGSCLWHDGDGRLLEFNGLGAGFGWGDLAIALRESHDNGATWTTRLMAPAHQLRHQVIANLVRTRAGDLLLCCDAVPGGHGGTALHVSRDGGRTWRDPGAGRPAPKFEEGGRGAWIAGIHAAVAELADGSLLAFGRGDAIDGHLAASRSTDLGENWTYSASEFPPIDGGQRLVLLRLREGPLLFCSFTDASDRAENIGMPFGDTVGSGLFAAVSFDDGATWPVRRLLTPGGQNRHDGGAWTGYFGLDGTHAEPAGYLAATQTPDGLIHLISSALYYRFNLAWLEQG
jgi:formylglycine-generating enzyme required for sulfatase activity